MRVKLSFSHMLAVLFSAALLLALTVSAYLTQLSGFLEQRALERLAETASTQAVDFETTLDRNYLVLEALSSHLSALKDTHPQTELLLLKGTQETAGFYKTGRSDALGKAILSDGQPLSVAGRQHFQSAMNGKRAIERVEQAALSDSTLFVLSVPVYSAGQAVGTVFGAYEPAMLDAFLNVNAFRGSAEICILDEASNHIAASSAGSGTCGELQLLLADQDASAESAVLELRSALASGAEGSGIVSIGGKKYCVSCVPLSINRWVLVSIVPAEVANSEYAPVFTLTWVLIVMLAVIFLLLTIYFSVIYRRSRDEMARAYQDLAVLNDGLPGGVFKLRIDDRLTLLYESDGFCRMTGYTAAEMQETFGAAFLPMVADADRETVLVSVRDALRRDGLVQLRFRIRKKDAGQIWVSAQYRYVVERGEEVAYGMMLDITERVQADLEADFARRKYRLALEHTSHVFLEYDLATRTLRSEDPKCGKFGLPAVVENMPEGRIALGGIDEGSLDDYRALYAAIHEGAPYASAEIRLRSDAVAEPVWARIDMTTLFDEEQHPVRAVAILQNVSKAKRAERDALTGLYNRLSAEEQIRETLLTAAPGSLHAFVMLDLDNFKSINDTCGHLEGDRVIRAFSDILQYHFRASDVLARFGGDEFAVFLRNLRETQHAVVKVQEVLEHARSLVPAGMDAPVSVSAGIAFCPDDGDSFEVLYENADSALYRAKKQGKSRLSVCGR